jgi:hypothetical protein
LFPCPQVLTANPNHKGNVSSSSSRYSTPPPPPHTHIYKFAATRFLKGKGGGRGRSPNNLILFYWYYYGHKCSSHWKWSRFEIRTSTPLCKTEIVQGTISLSLSFSLCFSLSNTHSNRPGYTMVTLWFIPESFVAWQWALQSFVAWRNSQWHTPGRPAIKTYKIYHRWM